MANGTFGKIVCKGPEMGVERFSQIDDPAAFFETRVYNWSPGRPYANHEKAGERIAVVEYSFRMF